MYAEEGQNLDAYVEVTLKDDDRNDPLITDEALEMLGVMTKDEYKKLVELTKQIAEIIKSELAKKNIAAWRQVHAIEITQKYGPASRYKITAHAERLFIWVNLAPCKVQCNCDRYTTQRNRHHQPALFYSFNTISIHITAAMMSTRALSSLGRLSLMVSM